LNQPAKALDAFEHAIALAAEDDISHYNRGRALRDLGRHAESLQSFERALALSPRDAEFHLGRGSALIALEQSKAALEAFTQALALQPNYAEAHLNSGIALCAMGNWLAAINHFDKALDLRPGYIEAHHQRCVANLELGDLGLALQDSECAIRIDANSAIGHNNRGVVLERYGRCKEALIEYAHALNANPDFPQAHFNRGTSLKLLNRLDEALAAFACVLMRTPGDARARWNSALCRLLLGDFENGWPGYEWRWQEQAGINTPLATARPRWSPGSGARRLLIWPEQGVGDEIMFGSLLPEARALSPELLVMLDPRLIPLFSRSMPDITFVPKSSPLDESRYDAHLPIASLCQYLRPNADAFARTPRACLHADPARRAALRAELQAPGKRLCGISWRSGGLKTGAERSLDLSTLVAALDRPDITLVNLQYGNVDAEIDAHNAAHHPQLQRCAAVDIFNDLDGLAALVAACDEVVSVDNTTVHLAGALGVPCTVLLPFHPDWRWQLKRPDSPWYPSVNLLRQHAPGNWSAPLQELRRSSATVLSCAAPPTVSQAS
jgi:Flp pilus assembly protein TadD